MFISTTTLTSSPSDLTAVGQKQEACSSIGLLARQSPSDRPLTTPSSTTLSMAIRQPNWSEADTLFQELLHDEGFTDIRYVDLTEDHIRQADAANSDALSDMIARREVDFGRNFAPALVMGMNAGAPVTILSGLHLGCFEVFGKEEIRSL